MVDYQIFVNNLGVLQGEIISPLPFSLYVNDCEMEFLTDKNTPIHYKRSLYFFLLIYAEDMVILSQSAYMTYSQF